MSEKLIMLVTTQLYPAQLYQIITNLIVNEVVIDFLGLSIRSSFHLQSDLDKFVISQRCDPCSQHLALKF